MLLLGGSARAQPDGETTRTPEAGETASQDNEAEAGPYRIEPPAPLTPLAVSYPEDGVGHAIVTLKLHLNTEGRVVEATALADASPLTIAAERGASSWLFTPARRIHTVSGKTTPISAKIRVEVEFTPPRELPPLEGDVTSDQTYSATGTGAPPLSPEVEVTVTGVLPQTRHQLSKTEVRLLPGAFGDPFRAVEVLPGVTPIASGLPFFYVRGAPPNNSGYFLGDIPMPALFHVGGGPGVIHPAFIGAVTLYPSIAPVEYGRFAGAMIGGELTGPEYRRRNEISVRLIDAGVFSEIPIASGQGSVMLGGRYSYTGLLVPLVEPGVEVGYWDYQGKVTYALTPRDTIHAFAFGAHDFLAAELDNNPRQTLYDVTFHRLHLDYVRSVNEETAWSVQALGLWDQTSAGSPNGSTGAALRRFGGSLRSKLTHSMGPHVSLNTGVSLNLERLDAAIDAVGEPNDDPIERNEDGENQNIMPRPGIPDNWEDLLVEARRARRQASLSGLLSPRDDVLTGAWLNFNWTPVSRVTVSPGVRLDHYKTGSASAIGVDPRITARIRLSQAVTAVHGVGVAHQPPSFGAPIPGLSASVQTGLQRALQSYSGLEWRHDDEFVANGTLFQSALFNGSDALGLLNLQRSNVSADAAVDRSTGHSYGLELSLQRPFFHRLGGFFSYTLSRSTRAFGTVAGPASFDRTHVVNAAVSYDLGWDVRAGVRAVVYAGLPAEVAYRAAAASPPRGPFYFRLDWRIEKRWDYGKGRHLSLIAETLNTTLAKETLDVSCYAYGCTQEEFGPVTLPSLGIEARF